MEIFIEKNNETINFNLEKSKKLIEILDELNITKESIILIKNDEIVLEDTKVENTDKIKILSVVSGG